MSANTTPIFSQAPDVQWIGVMTAANTTKDITSGTSYLAFTADATNGGFVREIRIKADPANNTAATVFRVWINNGSSTGSAGNSSFFCDLSVPATTTSNTNATPDFVIPLNIALPAGYKLYLTMGTAPGGSGQFSATTFGGKY